MSIQQTEPHIPEWTLGDRMRKAMEDADLRPAQIGEYLGVARNTVSTWIHDRVRPDKQTLMLWALRTGVPYEWLKTGECPHGDSNSEPTDYQGEPSPLDGTFPPLALLDAWAS